MALQEVHCPRRMGQKSDAIYFRNPTINNYSIYQLLSTDVIKLASFIRAACKLLENERNIVDYHLQIRDKIGRGLQAMVLHGQKDKKGPKEVNVCISCDISNPVSTTTYLGETEHTRFWFDAQGRNIVVATPKRHVGAVSSMSDQELVDFFIAIRTGCNLLGATQLASIILNHGTYRNHAHLHAKVRLADLPAAQEKWPQNLKDQWQHVTSLSTSTLGQYIKVSSNIPIARERYESNQSPTKVPRYNADIIFSSHSKL